MAKGALKLHIFAIPQSSKPLGAELIGFLRMFLRCPGSLPLVPSVFSLCHISYQPGGFDLEGGNCHCLSNPSTDFPHPAPLKLATFAIFFANLIDKIQIRPKIRPFEENKYNYLHISWPNWSGISKKVKLV